MNVERIKQAYQVENAFGSYFTAPLRAYNRWMGVKWGAGTGSLQNLAWKVVCVVTAIFAYLTLGVFALIGTAINFVFHPLGNGYSLWAYTEGIPKETETFCRSLKICLEHFITYDSGRFSTRRNYTYQNNQLLKYTVPKKETCKIEVEEEDGSYTTLSPIASFSEEVAKIQNQVFALSRKYNWVPYRLSIRPGESNTKKVTIRVPDHIPLSEELSA